MLAKTGKKIQKPETKEKEEGCLIIRSQLRRSCEANKHIQYLIHICIQKGKSQFKGSDAQKVSKEVKHASPQGHGRSNQGHQDKAKAHCLNDAKEVCSA